MDPKVEEQLNQKVKASLVVKTTPEEILTKYRARQELPKKKNYRVPFFASLGALATACVAIAILLPFALKTNPTSSNEASSGLTEINVSPLKEQEGVLSYELTSVYPLLQKAQQSAGLHPKYAYLTYEKDAFEKVVDSYENIEPSIREVFLGKNEDPVVQSGSFSGVSGTYTYKVELEDVGDLLYNVVKENTVWKSLAGELAGEDGRNYTLSGTNAVTPSGNSNLHLSITGSNGYSAQIEQNTNKGLFFFSYNVYVSNRLSLAFSLSLQQYQKTNPAVISHYYFADEDESGTFTVIKNSQTVYRINGAGFSDILLTYKNAERIYTYGSFSIMED